MQITRTSDLSGITRTREIAVTRDQLARYYHGALIQEAFPNLTPSECEFIKTGITDEEWDKVFGNED